MSYKSLMTFLTESRCSGVALRTLETLAGRFDAHAEAVCLGIDRMQVGYYYAGATADVLDEAFTRARAEANDLEALAEGALKPSGLRWNTQTATTSISDVGNVVAHRARFSDLVILPQPYGPDRDSAMEAVTEAALFGGDASVLVVPDDPVATGTFDNVIIAWNESREALAAVRRALPIIQAAKRVQVTLIDPPGHGPPVGFCLCSCLATVLLARSMC